MSASEIVAYAVTRGDDPRVIVAEDEYVLTRAVALQLVAATPASSLPAGVADTIRQALLDERWDDAVGTWIEATGTVIDIFPPTLRVWTDERLDAERTTLELRVAPIFDAAPPAGRSAGDRAEARAQQLGA